jgi:hypothetical protein
MTINKDRAQEYFFQIVDEASHPQYGGERSDLDQLCEEAIQEGALTERQAQSAKAVGAAHKSDQESSQ